jgi:hypothetical protein
MIVFLSHRHLKPGAYAAFRAAWEPEETREPMERAGFRQRIYHARALGNPDEVISFGVFDVEAADLGRLRAELGGEDAERARQAEIAKHVESTGVDAIFEVIEELRLNAGDDPERGVVFLTHRRLKPGSFDAFREAWLPEAALERLKATGMVEVARHARSLENPDEIVSFGVADLDRDGLERMRTEIADAEGDRQQLMAEHVEWTGVDGIFEIVEAIAVDPSPHAATA